MTDPKRLLDDTGMLTSEERQVLAADARFGAPPEARSQLWSSVATAMATTAIGSKLSSASGTGSQVTPAAAGSASGAHALSLGAISKLTLVGIGIGTSIATANHFWSAREVNGLPSVISAARDATTLTSGAFSASAVQNTSVARPSESVLSPTVDHQGSATAPNPAAPLEPFDTPAAESASSEGRHTVEASGARVRALASPEPEPDKALAHAREESQLVGSARSMLRAGKPAVALQLIELATSRFPRGILIQERETLHIEALTALGRTSEARALTNAFIKTYPNSPHVSRVKGRD